MALHDLDLEFEDEEEAKKKKNEAVHVDVDLEFSGQNELCAPSLSARPTPTRPGTSSSIKRSATAVKPLAQVKNITQARGTSTLSKRTPLVMGANALKEDLNELESQEVLEMREHIKQVQYEADVKVAIAEFKTDLLTELLSDMKLMEHQVGQLLLRINAKHPDLKQEVLTIKKILADFTSKKRK